MGVFGSYPNILATSSTFCFRRVPAKAHVDRNRGEGQRIRFVRKTVEESTDRVAHSIVSSVTRRLPTISLRSAAQMTPTNNQDIPRALIFRRWSVREVHVYPEFLDFHVFSALRREHGAVLGDRSDDMRKTNCKPRLVHGALAGKLSELTPYPAL